MQKTNLLLFIILLAACTAKNKTEETTGSTQTMDTTSLPKPKDTIDNVAAITLQKPVVNMELSDDGNYYILKKTSNVDSNAVKPDLIVKALNATRPKVQMVLGKVSKDTVYISIPESMYLTSQMGSTGAEVFLANTIYNLTEVKGIRFVNLDFTEGDHLAPGTYSRKDFKGRVRVK
jgi:hypothetical protein